ncbi:hypothetical protein WI38_01005 [Burkholderia ubonensis]|uniref:Uncharacterized protein n=1 Tax=Burkholderia ubonensis TaxID=101571 RepID=A0A102KZU3_9BURK|nr:hypothetical protein WI35_20960 [Burkholderia ubonensis]KUZ84529.1 hypothetical protein WI38_01005 [Burkholderia ubonensis]KUZ92310.1 hypothetical protein WI39_17340 [Burkholderia ubonensis]
MVNQESLVANNTNTITMSMRELDRLKVVEAVVDGRLILRCLQDPDIYVRQEAAAFFATKAEAMRKERFKRGLHEVLHFR